MAVRSSATTYPRKRRDIPRRGPRMMTTLGDLILALTEETRKYVHNDEEVYRLVSYMVSDLLIRPPRSHKPIKKWN